MQIIHGKKGTFRKRKFKQPGIGSFFKGFTQAKEVLKNKKVVRNATLSGSTRYTSSAAASTLAPAIQHLRTIQVEQQQRVAAEAKGLPSEG